MAELPAFRLHDFPDVDRRSGRREQEPPVEGTSAPRAMHPRRNGYTWWCVCLHTRVAHTYQPPQVCTVKGCGCSAFERDEG